MFDWLTDLGATDLGATDLGATDLGAFATSVERLALVRWIATADRVYPALSALHILSLALIVGPILLVDLAFLGLLRDPAWRPPLRRLAQAAMIGVACAIPTGVALASVQIGKYAANPAFQIKLALITLAIANALAFRRRLARTGWPGTRDDVDPASRLHAAASLTLWLGVVFAGRWIAFV
jgi:hypothetical protein